VALRGITAMPKGDALVVGVTGGFLDSRLMRRTTKEIGKATIEKSMTVLRNTP